MCNSYMDNTGAEEFIQCFDFAESFAVLEETYARLRKQITIALKNGSLAVPEELHISHVDEFRPVFQRLHIAAKIPA